MSKLFDTLKEDIINAFNKYIIALVKEEQGVILADEWGEYKNRINDISDKVENKLDKDIFEEYKADNMVYCCIPKRKSGETSDSHAISRAIKKLTELGGGEIRWTGTLEIDTPIDLVDAKVSMKGVGEVSIIKVIKTMDYCLKVDFNSQYGARGIEISHIYIDCNNLAKEGIRAGYENPVVQSLFKVITISNALEYGLVVDSTQNSQFTLVNMESCGGGIKLLNGAGNNVFLKCEVNGNKNGFAQILFDKDSDRPGYYNNGFDGKPQKNVFIGCITERISNGNNITINYGMSNEFISHEIECTSMTESSIIMRENANYNYISFRMACGNNEVIPILNEGYKNIIQNSYVENSSSQYLAKVTRTLIINGVYSNREFEILNNSGDAGYNVIKDVNAQYGDFDDLTMGQFGFDTNDVLKFKGKNKLVTIKTE